MTSSDPPSTARSASYARFIPREELGGVKAWTPGDISGGPSPKSHIYRAPEEAPPVDVAAQIAAQLRATRQAGYQDGYRDGLVALDAFKASFAAQTTAQVGTLIESMEAQFAALQQEMARTLAIAATHLAREIARSELTTRPELINKVAQEAIDTLLLSAQHVTLRVHPDDHALVSKGAAEAVAARGARLLADATITRGGCVVDSDIGIIDATIEARWRRAVASLGSAEPWEADDAEMRDTDLAESWDTAHTPPEEDA